MKIGVDYYPEHWDRSYWEQDADLMKETGVQIVRLAEFAWSRFEPVEGEFHFEWLDEAIEIFAERDIKVVLCTPTNCPPLWLYEKYPDAIQVGRDGNRIATGVRGHRCYNNPNFLRHVEQIVDIMTKHYANNKAVIAWQIDNELESNFCCCDTCIGEYRKWLQGKYGTIENMNRHYGNNVWSGEYSSWEQVKPPMGNYSLAWYNPSATLDFYRYASDNVIQYLRMQTNIIRKNCPGIPITTNTWFPEHMSDYYKTFEELDFVSYDNYPTAVIPDDSETLYSHAFHLDWMRGIKKQNFWIMEQLSGGMGCWMPMMPMPQPGMIEGYSLQAMAHGADTVVHFRWRTSVSGAEMFWHGLIDHSNVPGRRFKEFAHLCETAKTLDFVEETEIKSQVAILNSSDNDYALAIQPQTQGMYYLEQMKLYHDAFTACGVNVDIIGVHEALDTYKVVVAPKMYITDMNVVNKLYEFVKNGGTLILDNRSGVKDSYNKCIMEPLPTVYRELVGAWVEEYNPLGNYKSEIRFADGTLCNVKQWCDILQLDSAEPLAFYNSNYYTGKAAITENAYGNGKAYYIGTVGGKKLYRKLAKRILTEAEVPFTDGLPDNVELTTREGNGVKVQFVFNNTGREQTFILDDETLLMQPFEMKILRK